MKKIIGIGLLCAAAGLCASALRKKQQAEQKPLYLTGSVVPNPDKKAIITSLDKAIDALEGKTGTVITFA